MVLAIFANEHYLKVRGSATFPEQNAHRQCRRCFLQKAGKENFSVIMDVHLNGGIPYKQSPIMIILKRVYDKDLDPNAYTILVDRLWPRGLSKKELQPDEWLKDIAPDDSLRKWFGHDPAKWTQFKKKYLLELRERKDLLNKIKKLEKEKGEITLLYAARDTEHNNAVVLKEALGG